VSHVDPAISSGVSPGHTHTQNPSCVSGSSPGDTFCTGGNSPTGALWSSSVTPTTVFNSTEKNGYLKNTAGSPASERTCTVSCRGAVARTRAAMRAQSTRTCGCRKLVL
jgi:hypothetical protein